MREVKLERVRTREFPPTTHFLDIQLRSYKEFLQEDTNPEERKPIGLEGAFRDIFPIVSTNGRMELEYVSYSVGKRNTTEAGARKKELTYSVPIKVRLRLKKYKISGGAPNIFEKEINLCDIPCITQKGNFIINGNDRVIVNQLHRSPGVIFEEGEVHEITKYGRQMYHGRIIPYRGAWVDWNSTITTLFLW